EPLVDGAVEVKAGNWRTGDGSSAMCCGSRGCTPGVACFGFELDRSDRFGGFLTAARGGGYSRALVEVTVCAARAWSLGGACRMRRTSLLQADQRRAVRECRACGASSEWNP